MKEIHIRFLIGAVYDVLPTPQNLKLWVNGNPSCSFCSDSATLKHILSGCEISLSQGRYMWQHSHVLKSLALGIENRSRQSLRGSKKQRVIIQFMHEGENDGADKLSKQELGYFEAAGTFRWTAGCSSGNGLY